MTTQPVNNSSVNFETLSYEQRLKAITVLLPDETRWDRLADRIEAIFEWFKSFYIQKDSPTINWESKYQGSWDSDRFLELLKRENPLCNFDHIGLFYQGHGQSSLFFATTDGQLRYFNQRKGPKVVFIIPQTSHDYRLILSDLVKNEGHSWGDEEKMKDFAKDYRNRFYVFKPQDMFSHSLAIQTGQRLTRPVRKALLGQLKTLQDYGIKNSYEVGFDYFTKQIPKKAGH